jgi:hypothetical protein
VSAPTQCSGDGLVVVGWDPDAYENIEGPCPGCSACRREAVGGYLRKLSELTDTCPHCEAPLYPRCLCWDPEDDEVDDE